MKKQILVILILIVCMLLVFCGCKENSGTESTSSDLASEQAVTSHSSSTPEISSHISSLDSVSTFSTSSSISSSKVIKRSVYATANPSTIPVGEELILQALVTPNDPNKKLARGTWSVSDESVVQFVYDENNKALRNGLYNCKIKALKPGTVTMTINVTSKEGNCSDTCTVTVVTPEDLERRVNFSDSNGKIQIVHVGETDWIGIGYSYGFFSIKDEEYKHEFKIADEAIAQVSYDKATSAVFVHGLKPGETTLTVTVYVGEKTITDTCRIRVEEPRNISAYPSGIASSFLSSN